MRFRASLECPRIKRNIVYDLLSPRCVVASLISPEVIFEDVDELRL